MYTFSKKAQSVAFLLIAIGVLALTFGFMKANSGEHYTDDEITENVFSIAKSLGIDTEKSYTENEIKAHNRDVERQEAKASHYDHAHYHGLFAPLFEEIATNFDADAKNHPLHFELNEQLEAHSVERVAEITANYFHAKHQRPWSNIMVSNFFFFALALGALFFYAIQYVSQTGWSAAILRIPQAMYAYLYVGGGVMLFIIVMAILHKTHLYHWMDDALRHTHMILDGNGDLVKWTSDAKEAGAIDNPQYDYLIAGKSGYLNNTFFLIRALIYIIGWIFFAHTLTKFSVNEDNDNSGGHKWYTKAFKRSAVFAVFFAVSSSMMAWDWIMSIDPHWFSTLFGWFVFAGMWVSAITVIMMITVFLKKLGHLPMVNENHYHDYGRMMLAFSNLWMYLWFAQFMLIWYANIPEEVTYYWIRFEEYKWLFLSTIALNWMNPILFLMSRDSKRSAGMLVFSGILMLVGHAINVYMMVMPGSVGTHWHIGFVEIGTFLGFGGLFLFVVLRSLSKRPLVQKNHPMMGESEHHTIH
ncbi:MAG: quinol:cytochrome C oxidoreductase [Flavobacteriales bacterium]